MHVLKKESLREFNLHSRRREKPTLRTVLLFQETQSNNYIYIYICTSLKRILGCNTM